MNNFGQLKSNLVYVRCFRVELQGQEEYYLTALESALEFVQNLQASDLKLDPGEDLVFQGIIEGRQDIDLLQMQPAIAMTDTDEV